MPATWDLTRASSASIKDLRLELKKPHSTPCDLIVRSCEETGFGKTETWGEGGMIFIPVYSKGEKG